MLVVPIEAIHLDECHYENASQFDGFRFTNADKSTLISSSKSYMAFGRGKHSWYVSHVLRESLSLTSIALNPAYVSATYLLRGLSLITCLSNAAWALFCGNGDEVVDVVPNCKVRFEDR
jgi:hypothetical protein